MDEFLIGFAFAQGRIENAFYGAFFGAGGGFVISLIIEAIAKTFNRKVPVFIRVVCIVAMVQLTFNVFKPYLREHYAPQMQEKVGASTSKILGKIKEDPMFDFLFKAHPEAEIEFIKHFNALLSKQPPVQNVVEESQQISGQIVLSYLYQDIWKADDDVVYALLKRSADAIKGFQQNPSQCVGYYNGQLVAEGLPKNFLEQEMAVKAVIFKNAIGKQRKSVTTSFDQVADAISSAYESLGYDPSNMQYLDKIHTLPSDMGCKVVTEFSEALAAMPPAMAVGSFRVLTAQDSEPSNTQ